VISQTLSSHHITKKSAAGVDRAQPTQLSARVPSVGSSLSVVWVSFELRLWDIRVVSRKNEIVEGEKSLWKEKRSLLAEGEMDLNYK
jgi:hypothetical protein